MIRGIITIQCWKEGQEECARLWEGQIQKSWGDKDLEHSRRQKKVSVAGVWWTTKYNMLTLASKEGPGQGKEWRENLILRGKGSHRRDLGWGPGVMWFNMLYKDFLSNCL